MTSAFDGFVLNRVALAVGQVTHVDPATISGRTRLTKDLALGRFGRLRLAICLEEVFDVELSDEVVASFVTVDDVVGYFSRRYFRDFSAPVQGCRGLVPQSFHAAGDGEETDPRASLSGTRGSTIHAA